MGRQYYGELDTVALDPRYAKPDDLPYVRASINGSLMWDMFVRRVTPVLSLPQIIDNAELIRLVSESDDETEAVLGYIRAGRVEACLLNDQWLVDTCREDGNGGRTQPTIINAFLSRLNNGFQFASWPELRDQETRDAAREALRSRNFSALQGMASLEKKVHGIARLSDAFTDQFTSEANPLISHLRARIVADLEDEQTPAPVHIRKLWVSLRKFAEEKANSLSTRSQWYAALDMLSEVRCFPETHGGVRTLRQLVNYHYNLVVAESVRALRATDETLDGQMLPVLQSLNSTPGIEERVAVLLPYDDSNPTAITWAEIKKLDDRFGSFLDVRGEEAVRREKIASLQKQLIVEGDAVAGCFRAYPEKLTEGVQRMAGAAAAGGAGSLVQPGIVGSLVGVLVGWFATPAIPKPKVVTRIAERLVSGLDEKAQKRALSRARRSLRTDVKIEKLR